MHVRDVVLVLALSLAACGAKAAPAPAGWNGPKSWYEETPVLSKTWTPIDAEPDWVKNPPRRDGYVRVVAENASDLRDIATGKTWPFDANDRAIRVPLTPVVGETAAKYATKVANAHSTLLARATSEEDGPNPTVPGNHYVRAWALWEIAIDDVVAELPAEKRDAARAALAAAR
jgi:hypothetical protein